MHLELMHVANLEYNLPLVHNALHFSYVTVPCQLLDCHQPYSIEASGHAS